MLINFINLSSVVKLTSNQFDPWKRFRTQYRRCQTFYILLQLKDFRKSYIISKTVILTCRVLAGHVLCARCFALLDAQIRDVEGRDMHVVRTVLMPQRTMPLRARQGQVVKLQFVPLVPV
jgi:hypothetical protein